MSNTDHTTFWNKECLRPIRHPPFYSYSQDVKDTTMEKAQITEISHEPSYKNNVA